MSTALANLVNSDPATQDTLKELATALNNDPNFATTITTLIGTKQAQITATLPLTLASNTLSIDLSAYATTASENTLLSGYAQSSGLSHVYQPIVTTLTNLSLNTLTVNGTLSGTGLATALAAYARISSLANYQENYSNTYKPDII